MDPQPAPGNDIPNSRIPKLLGTLNIVFASGLMICGLCSITQVAMIPIWGKSMDQLQKKVQTKEDAERKAAFEELDAAEKEARTDEQKAELRLKRKEVELRPRLADTLKMNVAATGLTSRKVQTYSWVEFLSGVLLNLLMLAAGI